VPKTYSSDLANPVNAKLRPDDDTDPVFGDYSALISCPEWAAVGFPGLILFNWSYNSQYGTFSNITTQLIFTGSNAGTYVYYPRTAIGYGDASEMRFNVTGLYVETYSVAGIYSYSKAFNYTFVGTSYGPHFIVPLVT